MNSLWENTENKPNFEELNGDIKTDVLIIGGGITGILCAYMLEKEGIDYTLVEAKEICSGITKNTTAKITYQHGLIYDELINKFGTEGAKIYLESNKDALEDYKKICKEIDCDYEEKPAYVYSLNNREKIEKEVIALNKLGEKAKFLSEISLPFSVSGAVKISNQGQFNPLKFIYSISKNLKIFENTKVLELAPNMAITNRGKISCEKTIVATHFPFINKHGGYFLKMYQHRSYVIAIQNKDRIDGMYVDEVDKGMSFREYKDVLLIGGSGHRTGKKGGGWSELVNFKDKYYPDSKEIYRWATQDCITLDKVAYIGKYSNKTPDLFVATGFNKWGITSSMVSAKILLDLVREKKNDYSSFYSPSRNLLHPQLAVNIGEAMMGIVNLKTPRCPHLGCALKYNKQEHSWDCSCHGSRFSLSGEIIDNPATDDLKV